LTLARLTRTQRDLVGRCLHAAIRGPYLGDEEEFVALMGVTRAEAAVTLDGWPDHATRDVVTNALNNLLGYPHGEWRRLAGELGASREDVAAALREWITE
jgi:hypothetical protein